MVRELLDLEAPFTAFKGLPIAQEWRIFAGQDGHECMHPYWPEEALHGHVDDTSDWQTTWVSMFAQNPPAMLLVQASIIAERIGHGSWSFDYAKGKNGMWYLTDMATAENSYHMKH